MKKVKKITAVLICFAMLLTMLPLSAFAENEDLPVAPPPPAQDMTDYPGAGQPDPVSLAYDEEYKKALDNIFGEGACVVLKIRKYGGMKIDI